MSMDDLIKTAITNKQLLEFDYHSHHRITEPHKYGEKDSKYAILVYQIRGGSSSGGIPEWRRMFLNEISNMKILDETFPGKRPNSSGKHSSFDRTILIVK